MGDIKSLANGILSKTELTTIYTCPNNTQSKTTLLNFVNKSTDSVVLNVYKFKNNKQWPISPDNFIFGAHYMAQETDPITLDAGDALQAQCSVANKVTYVVNGEEITIQPTQNRP